ncbi:hypothetical protein P5745_32345, partial [Bacillus cereus]|uniref:hypothetical protein n=1 Tax=Bacillus cereus TaxID=1396 RepID=UPI002405CEC7
IIPLEYFTSKWLIVSSYMRRSNTLSEDDRGPMHALHATLILLKNLYYLDHFLQAANKTSLARRWLNIRSTPFSFLFLFKAQEKIQRKNAIRCLSSFFLVCQYVIFFEGKKKGKGKRKHF